MMSLEEETRKRIRWGGKHRLFYAMKLSKTNNKPGSNNCCKEITPSKTVLPVKHQNSFSLSASKISLKISGPRKMLFTRQ